MTTTVSNEQAAPVNGALEVSAVRAGFTEEKGFALMDKALAGKDYVAGPFSIADSALFYVEFWGAKRMNMKLPPNCDAHLNRMLARPAVQRVLQQEGLN